MPDASTPIVSREPGARTRGFLNREVIVATARQIADADGLEAVSMRTLADRLHCTPRALYRHVAGKDAVLELMADGALADLPEVRTDIPWQEAYLEFFTGMRQLLVDAPAVAAIIARMPVAEQHFRRHADRLVAVMLAAGFDGEVAVEAVVALAYYTLGASLPGTGQPLHDRYRERRDEVLSESLPALVHVAPQFAADAADVRFRSALQRLIRGYAREA